MPEIQFHALNCFWPTLSLDGFQSLYTLLAALIVLNRKGGIFMKVALNLLY